MKEAISLYELNCMVADVVNQTFSAHVWITAEIAQMNTAGNGHCYLELVEKSKRTGAITARVRAMIWSNRWWAISQSFEMETGQRLQAGLKVLVEVQVQMHESYGYSLVIHDIDTSYTMGEMQRKRQEILRRLTDEGMIDANKSLTLPQLAQRIAIVSASNAAGYGDFCHQLENNEWGIKFYPHLFPAILQGEQTESSVIAALDRIYKVQELFDVVVIIRGGGAVADLSSFDSYELALNVANFPLPVITGIGHERDTTVLDAVAHTSVKTPTAAAALLIDHMAAELNALLDTQAEVLTLCRNRMEYEKMRLMRLTNSVRDTHIRLGQQQNRLTLMQERIKLMAQQRLQAERQQLDFMSRSIALAQPDNILKRGFSIARIGGKAIKSATEVARGSVIAIETADGTFTSVAE